MSSKRVTKRDCAGCEQNFYNGNNPMGITECWSLKSAEFKTRFRLSVHTPMGNRAGYNKERRPNCYQQKGYVFLDQIPNYAK